MMSKLRARYDISSPPAVSITMPRSPFARAEHVPAGAGRAVVTWEGPGEPVMLTLYGPAGEEVALPLLPKRALTLGQELLTCGVQAIKADSWDAM